MKQHDNFLSQKKVRGFLFGYGLAVVTTAFSALLRWLLPWALSPAPYLGFYPAVVISAALGGVGPGLVSTFGSLLLVNLVFGQFNIDDHGALMRQVIWVVSSIGVSIIAGKLRTARIQAEQIAVAAHESDERLQSVLRSSSVGTFEVDLQSGTGAWNDVEFELLGLKPGEIPPNPDSFFRYVHPDDIATVTAKWEEALQSGDLDVEFRIVRADGTERWLAGKGRFAFDDTIGLGAARFMGVNYDITERKQAEEAVSRSQKIFNDLIERSPFGNYIVDSQFRIVMMNTSSQTGAFRNVHPVIGSNFAEAMHILWPEDVAVGIIGHFRHTLDTGEPYYSKDFINPRRDEENIEAYEWELHRIILPDGQNGVICYYYDSTKLRLAEKSLRASEERFRSVAENLSEGLMLFNPQDNLIYQNPASLEIHGNSVQKDGRIALENLPTVWQVWDDQNSLLPFDQWPVSRIFRGERVQNQVLHARRTDTGKEFDASYNGIPVFDAAGRLVFSFITIREITEQRKAEEALLDSEQQFRVLIQNLQSGVALINERGEFTIINKSFLRMFELDDLSNIKNVNDCDWSQWQVFDENGLLLDIDEHPVRKAVLTCCPVRDKLVAVKAPMNLKLKWLLVSAEPILGTQGQIHRLICTYHDITDRKQAEEALKKLNEELENMVMQRTTELREKDQMLIMQSRQASMGEMIGNIAHQWRQPLNVLGLQIQQLTLFHELGQFNKELLNNNVAKSMELIKHMSRTIDDFRNYFKPDLDKADFKIHDSINKTLSLFEGGLKNPQIDVEVIIKDDLVINGYQNEFAQVILNILTNARDAIIERAINKPKVTINIYNEGGYAVITVADNAGGIPEDIINKIFEPYFTTKGPQQGTGVGLFMSKSIIERNMGGRLDVRNVDDGAEFRIEVGYGRSN